MCYRKGHYYKLDAYAVDPNGTERMLTQQELRNQLAKIQADADSKLTCHPLISVNSTVKSHVEAAACTRIGTRFLEVYYSTIKSSYNQNTDSAYRILPR